MLKTVEVKPYPTTGQAETLETWCRQACRLYNLALENRIKRYKRRKQSTSLFDQHVMLTQWRSRIDWLDTLPLKFARDALRRVDRGFKAFFRRLKAGEKPGFPRFRSCRRYNSLECLEPSKYVCSRTTRIPKLGHVRSRGPEIPEGTQRLLRVIRRASGWFAQVLVDDGKKPPAAKPVKTSVGVDVGLNSFATLSTGEKIENPRYGRRSARALRIADRRLAKCQRGSRNRRKAVVRLRRVHERIVAQRRAFAHQESRKLVRRFDLIGFENLDITGMVANHSLARSIMDAAWGMFTKFLTYKAEWAGGRAIGVHAPGTSQECPWCGAICPKELSERHHRCNCKPGVVIDRDHASGLVIETRALVATGANRPVEETASTSAHLALTQAGPMKQGDLLGSH